MAVPAAGRGAVYPVVFTDALMVKIRDGVVTGRPVYLAIGIDCDGHKQVLGLWVGPTTGESAKFWMPVLSELRSRPRSRKVIYTTNLIESMNARLRKVTRNRGQFPSEQAALKVLYLAVSARTVPDYRCGVCCWRSSSAATVAPSSLQLFSNLARPSCSRYSVTSPISMPTAASCLRTLRAAS